MPMLNYLVSESSLVGNLGTIQIICPHCCIPVIIDPVNTLKLKMPTLQHQIPQPDEIKMFYHRKIFKVCLEEVYKVWIVTSISKLLKSGGRSQTYIRGLFFFTTALRLMRFPGTSLPLGTSRCAGLSHCGHSPNDDRVDGILQSVPNQPLSH